VHEHHKIVIDFDALRQAKRCTLRLRTDLELLLRSRQSFPVNATSMFKTAVEMVRRARVIPIGHFGRHVIADDEVQELASLTNEDHLRDFGSLLIATDRLIEVIRAMERTADTEQGTGTAERCEAQPTSTPDTSSPAPNEPTAPRLLTNVDDSPWDYESEVMFDVPWVSTSDLVSRRTPDDLLYEERIRISSFMLDYAALCRWHRIRLGSRTELYPELAFGSRKQVEQNLADYLNNVRTEV
jgi:hypothetical protein